MSWTSAPGKTDHADVDRQNILMKSARRPPDEAARLADLESYGILDTVSEDDFDDLTRIAASICGTPISLVSLIDDHRQWFKSRHGLDATETPREIAFCAHAILENEVFVVEDSLEDERFHDNPLVVGDPHVRFYAGAPLTSPSGYRLGTLCVIDHAPRELTEQQKKALDGLARQVVSQFELRKKIAALHQAEKERHAAEESLREVSGSLRAFPVTKSEGSRQSRRRITEILVPMIVFVLLLASTFWFSAFEKSSARRARVIRFNTEIEWVHRGIRARMREYEQMLGGCAALFAASEKVTLDEWRRYIESIEIDRRYTGILGIGYAMQIAPGDSDRFVSEVRTTSHADYSIRPVGERSDYFPVVYMEPLERNRAAIGFDIGSESNRRTAAERARDTGKASVTGKIILVQDDDRLAGFLLLVPVYRTGAVLHSVQQRRDAFVGWVCIASRFQDLMTQLPNVRLDDVAFRVWDGSISDESLLLAESSTTETLIDEPELKSTTAIELYGRRWIVRVAPIIGPDERTSDLTYQLVFAGGALISVLVPAFIWAVLATRRRALALADHMTTSIRRGQKHIQALLDNLAEAIVTIDDRGQILSANRAAEAMFGLRYPDAIGQPITTVLPESNPKMLSGMQTMPGVSQSGETPLIEVLASKMGAEDDQSTILIMRDVTRKENVEQEKALVQAASLAAAKAPTFDIAIKGLLTILSNFGDWCFAEAWLPDLDQTKLSRGPSWFKRDPRGVLTLFDTSSQGITFPLGEGLPGRCFARGEVVLLTDLANTAQFTRAALAEKAGLRTAVAIPVVTEEGEVTSILVFFSDAFQEDAHRHIAILSAAACQLGSLLQRKRYQDELATSEERYRQLFEGANDLIQSVSADGRILFVNRAWLNTLGYEQRDLEQLRLWDIVAPESRDHCERLFGDVSPGHDIGKVDAVFLTKSGDRRIMEGNVSCSFDGKRLVSTRGIFRDVTERYAVEKLKKEFVSTVSHELRTPLTSIRGSLDLLSGGVFGRLSEGAAEIVAIAHRNCTRLIDLINDILDLERLDAGRLELYPEVTSVATLVQEAVESLISLASQRRIRVTTRHADEQVHVDRQRMVQVLVNLLSNAIKFSEPDGEVRVLTRKEAEYVTISVSDDGKGIPAGFIDKVFDRFQQVESSDSRSKGGSGLGLAICRAIVEQHEGSIGAFSEEGQGSTFWIRLKSASGTNSTVH